MLSVETPAKTRRIIKKKKPVANCDTCCEIKAESHNEIKSEIEAKLNKLYPSSELYQKELEYDFDIDERFNDSVTQKKEVNHKLINKLTKFKINTNIIDGNDSDDEEIQVNEQVNSPNMDDMDIDKSVLEKELVGEKYYYFDYIKGIIYDLEYNIIGNIDDMGDINIENVS